MNHTPDAATLNIVQEVLRGMMLSLATAARADLGTLAYALESFTTQEGLEDISRTMLRDLAAGAHLLSTQRPQ